MHGYLCIPIQASNMVMFHMQTVLYRVSFAQFGFSMFFLRNLGAPAVVVEALNTGFTAVRSTWPMVFVKCFFPIVMYIIMVTSCHIHPHMQHVRKSRRNSLKSHFDSKSFKTTKDGTYGPMEKLMKHWSTEICNQLTLVICWKISGSWYYPGYFCRRYSMFLVLFGYVRLSFYTIFVGK